MFQIHTVCNLGGRREEKTGQRAQGKQKDQRTENRQDKNLGTKIQKEKKSTIPEHSGGRSRNGPEQEKRSGGQPENSPERGKSSGWRPGYRLSQGKSGVLLDPLRIRRMRNEEATWETEVADVKPVKEGAAAHETSKTEHLTSKIHQL